MLLQCEFNSRETLKYSLIRYLTSGFSGEAELGVQPPSAAGEQGFRHRLQRSPLQEK